MREKEDCNIKGLATVVFVDSFKNTNIVILENKDKGVFVSMPRYCSDERTESIGVNYAVPLWQNFVRHCISIFLMLI